MLCVEFVVCGLLLLMYCLEEGRFVIDGAFIMFLGALVSGMIEGARRISRIFKWRRRSAENPSGEKAVPGMGDVRESGARAPSCQLSGGRHLSLSAPASEGTGAEQHTKGEGGGLWRRMAGDWAIADIIGMEWVGIHGKWVCVGWGMGVARGWCWVKAGGDAGISR
ncbi:hypothetical protein Tco_1195427 [Tanacetum coccineum]